MGGGKGEGEVFAHTEFLCTTPEERNNTRDTESMSGGALGEIMTRGRWTIWGPVAVGLCMNLGLVWSL